MVKKKTEDKMLLDEMINEMKKLKPWRNKK